MSPEETTPEYQLRRATLEDLPELKRIWTENRFEVESLEKRFTEFQIAIDAWGQIAGMIGLHIIKNEGVVHSEAFRDLNQSLEIRPLLWERILIVAKNHGLVRLWMLPTSTFYREQGMVEITETQRALLPEGFGSPLADWAILKLKDETQQALAMEKEFEIFVANQRMESERVIQQATVLRLVAYLLLILALAGAGFLAVFAFKRAPRRKR
jgi:N-acetylglutamate synthase-like GNAT family acetyltransferase